MVLVILAMPNLSLASLNITTNPATLITNNSATLNATVAIFSEDATVRFRYTSTAAGSGSCNTLLNFTVTSSESYNFAGQSNGGTFQLTRNIANLLPATKYYFCAINGNNTAFGMVQEFTTTGTAGLSATSITHNSATLNMGGVPSSAGPNGAPESVSFRYTTSNNVSCSAMNSSGNSAMAGPNNNWSVSIPQTGLTPDTTYYYCAAIVPNANIGNQFIFSAVANFKTLVAPVVGGNTGGSTPAVVVDEFSIGNVVTMPTVLGLTDTEAVFAGRLYGGTGTLFGYFRYSEVEIPPIFCNDIYGSDMKSVDAIDKFGKVVPIKPGSFFAVVEGLQPDTQYAFCAVVSNNAKTKPLKRIDPNDSTKSFFEPYIGYGAPVVFRTLPCQTCPHTKIKTNPAEVLTSTSAYLKGNYGSTKKTTSYFEYVEVPKDPTVPMGNWISTYNPNQPQNSPGYRNFRHKLTGLKPNTWYNFRAMVETGDPDELFDGLALSFRTPKYNGLSSFVDTTEIIPEDDYTPPDDTLPPVCPFDWTLVNSKCLAPCPAGSTGIYSPYCISVNDPNDPNDDTCPAGWTGTPATGCVDPNPPTCPIGTVSLNGDCILVKCPAGTKGIFPACIPLSGDPACIPGTISIGPNGIVKCPTSGTIPTLPTPTCEDTGKTGTYPNCKIPVTTCEDIGKTGTYPDACVDPTLTCADFGLKDAPAPAKPGTCEEIDSTLCKPIVSIGDTIPKCPPGEITPLPTLPTCKELALEGEYPKCEFPVTSCELMHLSGIWPDCFNMGDTDQDEGDDGNQGDDNGGDTFGCNNPNDKDCGGIPDVSDSDIDGDGVPNVTDPDTDGDGDPNSTDGDDDGDGIPDLVDNSPTGVGDMNDFDGSGTPNWLDSDLDGDGIPNEFDTDTDGDGRPNTTDLDIDGDGIPNRLDPTPYGRTSTTGRVLNVGDNAVPDADDIVRSREGIEHVFARRIVRSVNLQERYGYYSSNILGFAYDLAHSLAKKFGYVDSQGKEIRVSQPDVSAYALRVSGNKTFVYEYYQNKIIDIRMIKNDVRVFKTKNPYEYYFKKKF